MRMLAVVSWLGVVVLGGSSLMTCAVGDDGMASPAVQAYLASLDKCRPEILKTLREEATRREAHLKSKEKIRGESAAKARARKMKERESVKALQARIKELESDDTFLPPEVVCGQLQVGFAGHVVLNYWDWDKLARVPAVAKVSQIIDDQSAIVEIGKRDYWLTGLATGNLDDGSTLNLDGVVYCSGNKTYTTVLGASKTVLVLEAFDEKEVLPHLPEKKREAFERRLKGE